MKRITKAQLHEFVRKATDVTTLQTNLGTWAAIVTVDGQDYEVETEATNPIGDATIQPVSREQVQVMIRTDYRTVRRY